MPSLTFPDSISVRSGVVDCRLLLTYYRAHPEALTEAQRTAVEGYTPGTCGAWDRSFINVIVADHVEGCGIPAEMNALGAAARIGSNVWSGSHDRMTIPAPTAAAASAAVST